MIYVVSGHPRSGTTAMMRALEAGGMEVVNNPTRTETLHRFDDRHGYRVQPGDVYEPSRSERKAPAWPRMHDGAAVKAVTLWLGDLAVHRYCVVFMLRAVEEIRQSCEAAFETRKLTTTKIRESVAEGIATLENRRDVEQIVFVEYADLVAEPKRQLSRLGWPINLELAAEEIDQDCRRFDLGAFAAGA